MPDMLAIALGAILVVANLAMIASTLVVAAQLAGLTWAHDVELITAECMTATVASDVADLEEG